jgi:RNA polymerase sigma-70 factor (ECF subfamily)
VALVERARAGSRTAFEILWRRNAPALRAILRSIAPDQDAEDLLQDVVVATLCSIHQLRDAASFPSWLRAIARNAAVRARSRARAQHLPLVEIDPETRPTEPSAADEILDSIHRLPECYREPLLLRLVLQLSGAEIAKRTGMTEGSVRVNLHRGMRLLRRRLRHWE